MSLPVIVDTDPGIDDAMAILYALAEPEIDLIGLTTVFGNVPVAQATRNALGLLESAGAAVPVAGGAAVPLEIAPPPHPDFVHGASGLGEVRLPGPSHGPDPRPAWDFLAETCAARPGTVIVAVGPLTNLALALDAHPAIAREVGRVVVMGGAVRRGGNVTPWAEANIWQDPHAAAKVLAAPWPVTLVGLDVTTRVRLAPGDLGAMQEASPRTGALLAEAAAFYFDFHRRSEGFEGCFLHDPTAVIAALDPEPFATEDLALAVALDGPEIGRTAGTGPGPTRVCLGVEAAAVRRRFLGALGRGRLP